jgi:prepilin signal peptidase PulO-like enzyme (type II secretory pathway)
METLALFLVLPALMVGTSAVIFGLGQVVSLEGLRRIGRNLWPFQFNLWQMMTGVALAAFVLMVFEWRYERIMIFTLISLLVLAWFVRNWRNEFVFLMGLRDDDLPGRNDKLIWAILLVAFAPLSIWFFRSYRLAHWPEPEPAHEPSLHAATEEGTATQPA